MTNDQTPDRLRRILSECHGTLAAAPDPRLSCQQLSDVAHLHWGRHNSPFGPVLAAAAQTGLCWLNFITSDSQTALGHLAKAWPQARLSEEPAATRDAITLAFEPDHSLATPLPLLLRGTTFQYAVWQALLRIPRGTWVSYGDIATAIGHAKAVRAVGSAVGSNPISVLVPCHRVISKTGYPFKYGGGAERKKALLAWEGQGSALDPLGPAAASPLF